MTAKECLHHDWLRGAPTQASPHLRRYLSKSREVLLERVVSRENLRRVALMSQTTSQASLCQADIQSEQSHHHQQQDQQDLRDCLLSQSEMCLNHCLTGSRSSLTGSEGFPSPADSQASLNSSRTSLSCASQSCLLNQEQTQGLLSKAQSRSQANLNQGLSRGILSRIRSLNRVQSQACLLNGPSTINTGASMSISKSREKLYGLKSLSKSQGVLDIYRSLECLKRRRKSYQGAKTEDMLPIFKRLDAEIASSRLAVSSNDDRTIDDANSERDLTSEKTERKINQNMPMILSTDEKISKNFVNDNQDDAKRKTIPKKLASESEENLDSLKSVESDTLTEDSDEMPLGRNAESSDLNKRPCKRQPSDVSSRSNNSAGSDDKEDRSTESETEEPKYTVAQLVSAFNKHQEVASKTSLEAIMTEKRINEVTFPTGTKALRLFIPDINITESKIVRRKTSYKPRKNWEELRKRNEKNEGVLKSLNNDSGNEDEDDEDEANKTKEESSPKIENDFTRSAEDNNVAQKFEIDRMEEITNLNRWPVLRPEESNGQSIFVDNANTQNVDTTIDEKYKQCVKGAMSAKIETFENKNKKSSKPSETRPKIAIYQKEKERLPNYIYSDLTPVKDDRYEAPKKTDAVNGKSSGFRSSKIERIRSNIGADTANVNLKDILQRADSFQNTPKENLENLRKRTSITKIILNDNLVYDSQDVGSFGGCRTSTRAKSESPTIDSQTEDGVKLMVPPPSFIRSSSLSSDSSCPTPSSVQSDINMSWEDVQTVSSTSLEKEDMGRTAKKSDIQRTSSEGRKCSEERKIWGRICTGSYTRAMEKFSGKNINTAKKSILTQQAEKTRRKSSPAMSQQYINP